MGLRITQIGTGLLGFIDAMKGVLTNFLICACGALAVGCQQTPATNPPTRAVAGVSGGADTFFRDELSRSGEWIDLPDYGPCWYPSDVAPGWRPYTQGRWVWTDGVGW